MLFLVVLTALAASAISDQFGILDKEYYDVEIAEDHFENFIAKYGKNYLSANEVLYRLKVFKENMRKINELNLNSATASFAVHEYSDLTFEEFVILRTGFRVSSTLNPVPYKPVGGAPDKLDYRQQGYVTEVKNQGNCGSCYVFSAIGNIEGVYAKATGQLISLSEQEGLDCDRMDSGCDGGIPDRVMQALAQQGGVQKQQDYPYEGIQKECRADQSKIAVKVTGGQQIGVNNEEALKDALANYGPLSITLFVSPSVENYISGILDPADCGSPINHAVLLVGYGTEGGVPYWIIKNSWGTVYGESGYLRIVRGKGACQIGTYAASAQVSP